MNEIVKMKLQKCENVLRNLAEFLNAERNWIFKGAKMCKPCRSRQGLSNEYLLAKCGVDTAENGPLKLCKNSPKLEKN